MVHLEHEKHFVQKLYQKLLPSDTNQFIIIRGINEVKDVRIENVEDPDFPLRYKLFSKMSEKSFITKIINDSTIDNAVDNINKVVFLK